MSEQLHITDLPPADLSGIRDSVDRAFRRWCKRRGLPESEFETSAMRRARTATNERIRKLSRKNERPKHRGH